MLYFKEKSKEIGNSEYNFRYNAYICHKISFFSWLILLKCAMRVDLFDFALLVMLLSIY